MLTIRNGRIRIEVVLKVILLLLASLFLRPTVLGSTYTSVGLTLSIVTLFYTFYRSRHLILPRQNILIILSGSLLFIFLFFQGMLSNSLQPDFVIRSTTANLLVIVIFGYCLSNRSVNETFFKGLVLFWAILGFSSLITIIAAQIVSLDSLYLFQIPIKGVNTAGATYGTADLTGNVYLPFSLYYKYFTSGIVTLYRFMIFFREPGIAQAFLIWGIIYALHYRYPRKIIIGLIIGVLTTFSTSGAFLLFATLLLWYFAQVKVHFYIKMLAIVLSFAFSPVVLIFTPYVGLVDKIQTHGISIETRLTQISDGLITAFNYPFGLGYYSQPGTGINLLSVIGQIGLIGFFLALAVYVIPLLSSKTNRSAYLIAIFPIFATMLVAQPIFDAPLVYIILFALFPTDFNTKLGITEIERKNFVNKSTFSDLSTIT